MMFGELGTQIKRQDIEEQNQNAHPTSGVIENIGTLE